MIYALLILALIGYGVLVRYADMYDRFTMGAQVFINMVGLGLALSIVVMFLVLRGAV